MADVIVTYVPNDEACADEISRALQHRGSVVRSNQEPQPGSTYEDFIERELQSAAAVVVLWSRFSATRAWVRRQAEAAAARGLTVTVCLDADVTPLRFQNQPTYIMPGWNGEPEHPAFAQIIGAVHSLLARARTPGDLTPPYPPQASVDRAAGSTRGPVFLSYSRQDASAMRRVRTALEGAGLRAWTDEHLEPGTPSWMKAIETAIDDASALVVLLSPSAKTSTWVDIELGYAKARQVPIYPVLVHGTPATAVPIVLINCQYVDAQAGRSRSLARLIENLKAI